MEKPKQEFRVEFRARIVQVGPQGSSYGNGLGIEQDFTVSANGFMELCSILARFHNLAVQIEKENS